MGEWMCIFPGRAIHFIRRTKQLGAFWLADFWLAQVISNVTLALSLPLTYLHFTSQSLAFS
jgi:hypothetical protein